MKNISNPIQSSSKSSFFSAKKIIALFRVLHLFFVCGLKISLDTDLFEKEKKKKRGGDKKKSLEKDKEEEDKEEDLLREEERL